MAAGAFTFYDIFSESIGDGTIDLDTDVLKVALHTSAYTPNVATDVTQSALGNEHSATSTGYTTGGATLANITWSQTGGVATLDNTVDTVWTAQTNGITARYAVIYSSTAGSNNLIGYFLLDGTPADVSATDGNTLTIEWNASGILTLTA